jgi:type III restriction enzyme
VDSEQLESGEGLSPELRKLLAAEIEEWKAEMRVRVPGSDPDKLGDEAAPAIKPSIS